MKAHSNLSDFRRRLVACYWLVGTRPARRRFAGHPAEQDCGLQFPLCQNCAGCHGANGKGGAAIALATRFISPSPTMPRFAASPPTEFPEPPCRRLRKLRRNVDRRPNQRHRRRNSIAGLSRMLCAAPILRLMRQQAR